MSVHTRGHRNKGSRLKLKSFWLSPVAGCSDCQPGTFQPVILRNRVQLTLISTPQNPWLSTVCVRIASFALNKWTLTEGAERKEHVSVQVCILLQVSELDEDQGQQWWSPSERVSAECKRRPLYVLSLYAAYTYIILIQMMDNVR